MKDLDVLSNATIADEDWFGYGNILIMQSWWYSNEAGEFAINGISGPE
jgi:hypothetical protein